ncbi:hypothetical protein ACHHYP_02744 [Achlya hypogyna]|uniref:Cytochrome P450 n=1 Tax=Achlya hypogyna TaxID=1202772 RepID=A0A1V9Z5H8_ACHHY|nr:hypothetical protein ACHHYP_02744 [Achlya hypogyna]
MYPTSDNAPSAIKTVASLPLSLLVPGSYSLEAPPPVTGYLLKRGKFNKAYKRRYFELHNGVLAYHKGKKKRGSIPLATVTNIRSGVVPSVVAPRIIELATAKRTWCLHTETADEYWKWVRALCEAVDFNVVDEAFRRLLQLPEVPVRGPNQVRMVALPNHTVAETVRHILKCFSIGDAAPELHPHDPAHYVLQISGREDGLLANEAQEIIAYPIVRELALANKTLSITLVHKSDILQLVWLFAATMVVGLVPLILLYLIARPYIRGLWKLPSPPTSSWLLGHAAEALGVNWDKGNYPEPGTGWLRQYGMAYYHRILHLHKLMLADPAALRHILVTNSANYPRDALTRTLCQVVSPKLECFTIDQKMLGGDGLFSAEGPKHTAMRKQVTPHFAPIQLKSFLAVIERHVKQFMAILAAEQPNTPINMHAKFTQLALDILGVTAFGYDFAAVQGETTIEIQAYRDYMPSSSVLANLGLAFVPGWEYLPVPSISRRRKAKETLYSVVHKVLEAKIASPSSETSRDLLDILILSDPNMTAGGACVHAMTFMIAGHETSSNTLCWVLAKLHEHPEVAQRVEAECRQVLGRHGGSMPYDALGELPYLTAVIQETMRLYPTAPALAGREAAKDDRVPMSDGSTVLVPKCTWISLQSTVTLCIGLGPMIFVQGINAHDAIYFHSLDRFLDGSDLQKEDASLRNGKGNTFIYMPFGAGVNSCIGQRFAMMELQVILVHLFATHRALKAVAQLPMDLLVPGSYTPAPLPPELVKGYAFKRGKFRKALQRRFFVLKKGVLTYYKNKKLRGSLRLDMVTSVQPGVINDAMQPNIIELVTADRTWVFHTESEADYEMWTRAFCEGVPFSNVHILFKRMLQLPEVPLTGPNQVRLVILPTYTVAETVAHIFNCFESEADAPDLHLHDVEDYVLQVTGPSHEVLPDRSRALIDYDYVRECAASKKTLRLSVVLASKPTNSYM